MFLCNPISFEDAGMGWAAVLIVLLFFFFVWNPIFWIISYFMNKKGLIKELIFKKIKNEFRWIWGFWSFIALAVPAGGPALVFIPIIMIILFPLYFTFSFITLWIKKELKEKGMITETERKFLMIYYGGISFLIIALGTFLKLKLHGGWGNLFYYYTQDIGKNFFIPIFIFTVIIFFIFWYSAEKWIQKEEFYLSQTKNNK
ncbi:MAG: hypothetical protein ACK4GR_00080 [bacterium]